MFRSILLAISRSTTLRRLSTDLAFAKRISRRFVAGETLAEAIDVVKELNSQGMLVSLDHLGEHVDTKEDAQKAFDGIMKILDAIEEHKLKANVSVKLTQLGLDVDASLCEGFVSSLSKRAEEIKTSVRIDMEGSAYTERTLDLFSKMRDRHKNVGIVIQSYLYRSEHDIEELITRGADIRICKGAYKEPKELAYQRKLDVDRSYTHIMDLLFSDKARRTGVRPCIATHDEAMITGAMRIIQIKKFPANRFEFQMLYGIRTDLQAMLTEQDFTVRVYVPFGEEWYPYFMRRLAERPANLIFLLKNLFRG